jgi:hypothetical protein
MGRGGQLFFALPAAVVSDSRGTASGMATGSLVGVVGGRQTRQVQMRRIYFRSGKCSLPGPGPFPTQALWFHSLPMPNLELQ